MERPGSGGFEIHTRFFCHPRVDGVFPRYCDLQSSEDLHREDERRGRVFYQDWEKHLGRIEGGRPSGWQRQPDSSRWVGKPVVGCVEHRLGRLVKDEVDIPSICEKAFGDSKEHPKTPPKTPLAIRAARAEPGERPILRSEISLRVMSRLV